VQPYSAPLRPSREGLIEALRANLGSESNASIKYQLMLGLDPYPSPAYRLIYLGDGGEDAEKIYISPRELSGNVGLKPLRDLKIDYVVLKRENVENPGLRPLVSALDMGGELLHPLLRERLARASRAIREGRGVAQSMEANGLTTPVALRMLNVGEKSGNMGEMLEQIAAFHDEEMARWVDWFTRLFEPILMTIIGLVIGVIVILMYMPIFELAGNLQ